MMIANFYKKASAEQILVTLSLIGMLVACWIMYIQQGWINDDSVLYFEAARLFSIGEWKSGLALFEWPLYSLLIAGLHVATTLNIQLCAQLLNAVFIVIVMSSLLRIILLAGGEKLTLLMATLLFLSTAYIVGDVVPMLLRDQGFWAFMLTALVFLIRFYRNAQLSDAIYWQLFAITALLFRIEAITYIVVLPLILLTRPNTAPKDKFLRFCKAHAINIFICLVASIAAVIHGSIGISNFGRVQEIFSAFSDIQNNFSMQIVSKAQVMANSVLGEPLENFAWMSLMLTFISIAAIKCISVAGWLAPILVHLNYKSIKLVMANDVAKILALCGLVVFINAVLIILRANILTSRYVIFFGFISIIFAAFAMVSLYQKWQRKQLGGLEKFVSIFATIVILLSIALNVMPKHAGYNYQKEAVDFVKIQNVERKSVFYVSPRARFYAGAAYLDRGYDYWKFTEKAIADGSIYQHDYLVINLDINEKTAEREAVLAAKLTDYELVKIFYGYKKKKRMLVYKKAQHAG